MILSTHQARLERKIFCAQAKIHMHKFLFSRVSSARLALHAQKQVLDAHNFIKERELALGETGVILIFL
jgi:hypothetical protein